MNRRVFVSGIFAVAGLAAVGLDQAHAEGVLRTEPDPNIYEMTFSYENNELVLDHFYNDVFQELGRIRMVSGFMGQATIYALSAPNELPARARLVVERT